MSSARNLDSRRVCFGFQAALEEVKFKKPKRMAHLDLPGMQRKIQEWSEQGPDMRYVLMEYGSDGNKQLKSKNMNRLEAYKRNKSLKGTGFAWAICGNNILDSVTQTP